MNIVSFITENRQHSSNILNSKFKASNVYADLFGQLKEIFGIHSEISDR